MVFSKLEIGSLKNKYKHFSAWIFSTLKCDYYFYRIVNESQTKNKRLWAMTIWQRAEKTQKNQKQTNQTK